MKRVLILKQIFSFTAYFLMVQPQFPAKFVLINYAVLDKLRQSSMKF